MWNVFVHCNKKSLITVITCLCLLPTSPNNVEDQSLLSTHNFNIVRGWEGGGKNILYMTLKEMWTVESVPRLLSNIVKHIHVCQSVLMAMITYPVQWRHHTIPTHRCTTVSQPLTAKLIPSPPRPLSLSLSLCLCPYTPTTSQITAQLAENTHFSSAPQKMTLKESTSNINFACKMKKLLYMP